MADPRAARAKDFHRRALKASLDAERLRRRRDALVRDLYATGDWSYKTLSEYLGVSSDLIAQIIKRDGS